MVFPQGQRKLSEMSVLTGVRKAGFYCTFIFLRSSVIHWPPGLVLNIYHNRGSLSFPKTVL